MNPTIKACGLGKQYHRYHANRPATLQEAALGGFRGLQPIERFWALRHVSFEITPGRMLGIVGQNGAGKSTLLRLLGGVIRPDEGSVQVHGRIGALFDLSTGFHAELTGRENVFVSGVIAGLNRRQVSERLAAIVDFADLGEVIDNPLRTYSTGMQVRLGFAVAAFTRPEVLLIDEVLAVGDIAFQAKCLDQIAQFKAAGTTIILVTHDTTMVQRFCDEAMWLRSGQAAAYGDPSSVLERYVDEMTPETRGRTPTSTPHFDRRGSGG